jgi:hypothetical protein
MTTTEHLLPAHDTIQRTGAVPNWTENLLFVMYDSDADLAGWAHRSRCRPSALSSRR